MRVELLYFDDCPNWLSVLDEVNEVLAAEGVQEDVELVRIADESEAQRLLFAGSPTLRVNGEDIDPDVPQEGFNLECRIYWVGGRAAGKPPKEWIARAIHAAKES